MGNLQYMQSRGLAESRVRAMAQQNRQQVAVFTSCQKLDS